MANPATRILHVPLPAGNHMDMEVRDGLSRSNALVEAHIEAVRCKGLGKKRPRLIKPFDHCGLLGGVQFRPRRHMAVRDNQEMTRCYRKGVPDPL